MPLAATKLPNVEAKKKPYKLADGEGLYLLVRPDGSRYWRLKYRFAGKEKLLALGVYPDVSLKEAREKRADAKKLLRDGKDPGQVRRQEKQRSREAAENSFEAVAEEWIGKQAHKWDERHTGRVRASLKTNLYPHIGHRPLAEVEAPELLAVLRKIEGRGAHETRSRVQQRGSAVFRYGISTGRCSRDPAADLRGAFTPVVTTHHSALAEQDLPAFFQKLNEYDGEPTTQLAIRLMAYTFVRTVELRLAQWSEFDTKAAVWRIPAERMKSRQDHIVPLSRQALAVLEQLKPLTGKATFVFPHRSNEKQAMSENTILYALYRMGYHSRATGHGFRATASTILNERGFKPDVIERQLAHAPKDKTRAAYNRSQYLAERKAMMQQWADLLDELAKPDTNVVAGKFGKAAA